MASPKASRVILTLKEKLMIIKDLELGIKESDVMEKYNIKYRKKLKRIWDSREKIKERNEISNGKGTKSMKYVRESNYPIVEEAMLIWMRQMTEKDIPISTELIREKGKKFAHMMGKDEFKVSDTYIRGLMKRRGLTYQTLRSESGTVNDNTHKYWKINVNEISEENDDDDDDDDDNDSNETVPISSAEAFKAINTLQMYFAQNDDRDAYESLSFALQKLLRLKHLNRHK